MRSPQAPCTAWYTKCHSFHTVRVDLRIRARLGRVPAVQHTQRSAGDMPPKPEAAAPPALAAPDTSAQELTETGLLLGFLRSKLGT